MTPRFSVLIVNYNSGDRLARCLDCLTHQTIDSFEVIVIDNASADGSQTAANHSPFPVQLISSKENLGFAAANNLAARQAKGKWLAFLNPDAYADKRWLEKIAEAIEEYPDAAAFGSMQIDAKDNAIIDGAGDVFHALGVPYRGHFEQPVETAPPEGECFAPCAAAAVYRRDVFEELGGFDESFFCYSEDVDLGFRLRLAGHHAIQLRAAVVLHEGSGVTGRYSPFSVYHGNRNRIWVAYKNLPGLIYWPLFPVQLAANLYFIARAFTIGFGKTYAKAIFDGYAGLPRLSKIRKGIQSRRKISSLKVARALTWSPLKLMKKAADIRER